MVNSFFCTYVVLSDPILMLYISILKFYSFTIFALSEKQP